MRCFGNHKSFGYGLFLLWAFLLLTFSACVERESEVEVSDEPQRRERHLTFISIESVAEENDELARFSWLDWITEQQLEIVREYLKFPEGSFDDTAIWDYLFFEMGQGAVREYDRIPFDGSCENPRRIIVKMWEAYAIVMQEYRFNYAAEHRITIDHGRYEAWGLDRPVGRETFFSEN
ncbi:MAG: hypothetical protein FWE91_03160 [Defluviitaleaceae bacterium]|nr:hypothetical protein [Defluviitaleaceae bacterium]MCL2836788.1 hypothetical protein [Defluviitaleaceae bacterium]